MVEKQIGKYMIVSPAKLSGALANFKLMIALVDVDGNQIGSVYYIPDQEVLPESSVDASELISMHKHLSQAAIDIDILRNESPVYAVYRSPTLAWIRTGSEPIGEGELVG